MASQHKHKQRVIRGADDQLWEDLDTAAQASGSDRSAVTRQLWEWYVGRADAKFPERPGGNAHHLDELIARIRSEGGVWDEDRAQHVCHGAGFHCSLGYASGALQRVARWHPELIRPVKKGRHWVYETSTNSERPATDATEEH